ncbi:MAG: nickel pincer cofactor biosynthesis protein LarB [Lachnospiraceae bacterium]|nr:nickel pincer cofactor biosynthesis protein LarB [Lachnospiraceae bacterium]
MENQEIYRLLQQVYEGSRTPEQAMEDMDSCLRPEMQVGDYADIDLHRAARQGMPEVIYGEGKTAEQIAGIIRAMTGRGVKNIMTTRLSAEKAEEVARMLGGTVSPISAKMESETGSETASEPDNAINSEETSGMDDAHNLLYDPTSRIGIANAADVEKIGKVVVVAAGTSDLPVAEEAAITAELNGSHVERVYDVGVAGLHRLLHRLPVLEDANVIIAVAGMEGALVSVVGGLVACPVIGVPTSVGYGANFGGAAALLSMLNSCASGVSVVNIDNGFGAGVLAARINRQSCKEK